MIPPKHIHFIGICGVAMSALAIAFHKKGWRVTGSDVGFYPPISTHLKEAGINYYPGWHPEKMIEGGAPDVVVVGNVAGSTNPEWKYVEVNKLPYVSYPELIEQYLIKQQSIVCTGTYGKTSNTTLLSWIFTQAKKDPSYMFGGLSANGLPAAALSDSTISIVEGDEYKSARWDPKAKFFHYKPTHLLLSAIKWDHADVYPTEKSYQQAFIDLVGSLPTNGLLVLSDDIPSDSPIGIDIEKAAKCPIIHYGSGFDNEYEYRDFSTHEHGSSFDIFHLDQTHHIETSLLGEYNAKNITGCFALAHEAGIDPETIIQAIQTFRGTKRRLEKRFTGDITVIDDIAHSPEKVKSILSTLRSVYKGKILAVFEPNTGNRKPASFPGYDKAFVDATEVIIPRLTQVKIDVKDPEQPVQGPELAEVIAKTHPAVTHIENDEQLIDHLLSRAEVGDVIVFLGSHGFRGMIEDVVTSLS